MKLRCLVLTLTATACYSCGTKPSAQETLKDSNLLPTAAIIAVKDSDTGDHTLAADDLRTLSPRDLQQSADKIQDQDLPILYDKAQKNESIFTEQQEAVIETRQHGWLHYRRCPGRLVKIIEVNQQEPLILDSCQAYHLYQPAYLVRGRAHRFFFQRAYRLKDVTYYYYLNQMPVQQVVTESKKQTQSEEQKQIPDQKQTEEQQEKQVEQENKECQKQAPQQKWQPQKTVVTC